ncbi:uncharacterized protein LOC135832706 [Planococcus citri]|uniref:uncharacterized protein LOC135832706 n=1 Tax=Planococcus citri TaxID=170843 RepID=UPI0031F7DA33
MKYSNMNKLPVPVLAWSRPENIPFPNVWNRFKSRPKNGKSCNIKIVDLTPDRYEEAIQFMAKYFLMDEPLRSSVKFLDDMNDTIRYLHALKTAIETRTSILAVLDEDVAAPEIVGIQILYVSTNGDPSIRHFHDPGEKIRKVKRIANDLMNAADPYEILGTDRLLRGFGLCVKPDYRGMDIGYNLLLCLEKLAKAYDVKGCMNMYSRIQSQVLAERVGFKVYNEVFYEDYKDEKGNALFPIKHTKSFKLMGIKYA